MCRVLKGIGRNERPNKVKIKIKRIQTKVKVLSFHCILLGNHVGKSTHTFSVARKNCSELMKALLSL